MTEEIVYPTTLYAVVIFLTTGAEFLESFYPRGIFNFE